MAKARKSTRQRIDENLKFLRERGSSGGDLDAQSLCRQALEVCAKDPAVKAACDYVGRDRNNPMDLANLLIAFASAHFIKGTRGRPTKRDPFYLYRVLNQFLNAKNEDPQASEPFIYRRLAKKHKVSPATMRRIVLDAADPRKNPWLGGLLSVWEEQGHRNLSRGRQLFPDWRTLPRPAGY